MVIKVKSINKLTESDIVRHICIKEGYSLGERFPLEQEGGEAAIYIVSRANEKYILKHYTIEDKGNFDIRSLDDMP